MGGIPSNSISVPKRIGNDAIMAYFGLTPAEYAYVVKTWTEGLLGLFILLGLPDTQVLRSGPADGVFPLTDARLLLAFPDQQDEMVVEEEVGRGAQIVPGGPGWRSELIPRETVNTDILHLNLRRVLGRAFFAQIAVPRLFQLLAPGLGTPLDPGALVVWTKLMDMPAQSSGGFLANNHHKFMVYQLAKVALGRARGRTQYGNKKVWPQREMSEGAQLDGVVELGCGLDSIQKLRDEQQIQQRSITPSGVIPNLPVEECRPHHYQHRVATAASPAAAPAPAVRHWWPGPSRYSMFGLAPPTPDGKPAVPRTICYDDGTPEGAAAFLNSLMPGLA